MNAPAAIQAQLVDVRNVSSHKCVRLEIHVPAEQAGDVMAAFGWPTMADPVPVALARLVNVPTQPPERERTPFIELPLAQQAALRCNELGFWHFIRERGGECMSMEEAARFVRLHCNVRSRADLIEGTTAGDRWKALEAEYYSDSRGRR